MDTAQASRPEGTTQDHSWLWKVGVVLAVASGRVMAMLDVTLVNIGRGDIQPEFTAPLSTLVWIVDAYTKEDASAFEDPVGELRVTEEWKFVDREIAIHVVRTE